QRSRSSLPQEHRRGHASSLSPRQVAIVMRVPPQSYRFNVVGAGLYCNAGRKGSGGPHRPPRSSRPSPCLRSNNGAFRGASFYSRRRGRECVVRKRYVVLPPRGSQLSEQMPIQRPTGLTSGDFPEAEEPFQLFAAWFEQAARSEPRDPTAMSLATVDAEGLPNVRMVLMKSFGEAG